MARLSPALPLIGGGRTRFQPVYVGDVADAIIRCLEDPACQAKTYELGGPRVYTFRQLIEIVLRHTRRPRLLVSIPFGLAELQAAFLELLPVPPLTRDQVRLLRQDNVVGENALTLEKLRIPPKALEDIIPAYLG
jgi:NADH dehydrogenase